MSGPPEPPDGVRVEFVHDTDRYAAWRDDASSAKAGWTTGDGGEVWCLYPGCVPQTWASLVAQFGDSLLDAVWLVPIEAQPERFPHGFVASSRVDRCRVCGDESGHRRHGLREASCGCELCQSGEGHYETRCPTCDQIVTVARGRYVEHWADPSDLNSRWCASSTTEAS